MLAIYKEGDGGKYLDNVFRQSFRAAYGGLSDKDAYQVSSSLINDLSRARNDLRETLGRLKDTNRIDIGVAERWSSLNGKWYTSGKSYRQIDSIDGTPNKWFQRWLRHPSYDKYWQDIVPYKDDFAKINIPVLTITRHYDDGQ